MENFTHRLAPFAAVARKLLRGPIYDDDTRLWAALLADLPALSAHFAQIGLRVEVAPADGYAFLDDQPAGEVVSAESADSQTSEDESDEDVDESAETPRLTPLIKRRKLSYGQTLLAVILRRRLDEFDRSVALGSKCFVERRELMQDLETFFEVRAHQPKQLTEFRNHIQALEDLGFLRLNQRNDTEPDRTQYEIKRIVKARLTPEILEEFQRLLAPPTMSTPHD